MNHIKLLQPEGVLIFNIKEKLCWSVS